MKKKIISLLFLSASLGLVSISPLLANKQEVIEVDASGNQHIANFTEYVYSGSYYDTITATGEGMNGSLRKELSDYILPNAWPSYSGSSATSLAVLCQEADEDPTNSNNMIYLYTRDSVKKNAASSWNREHVWPKSLSGNCWGTGKAGTDLLHLRPTYNTCNSTRSSIPFGEVTGGSTKVYDGMTFGYTGGGYFMPLDATKGDVARIIMYIWVAYVDYYGSLPAITKVFESYDTLLKWHTEDRPDQLEGHRNDYCQSSLQENRNPFVDHPEYAWMIFGDQVSSSTLAACQAAYPGNAAKLTSITVDSLPNKTTYFIDDTLDTTGLVVTAHYDDSTSKNVTKDCSITPTTFSSLGNKYITVSYAGKTAGFNVTVKDYETVNLLGVSAYLEEERYFEEKTYQIKTSINPVDAYPRPTITYLSNNTEVATVSNTGEISALKEGNVTITVTATQSSITKTATLNLLIEPKQLPTLSDLYDMKAGDEIEFYCQYLGSYVNANQGIFVGDGDYAALVYGYTESVSGFTPYQTYLKVSGVVDVFNNLYEVKSSNTVALTITEVSQELGRSKVAPITTYEFDGHEAEESDLSVASRPCVINGTVKSVTGTFTSNSDTKVYVTLDNDQEAMVFVKKNAGLDYDDLKDKLNTIGAPIIVKGFVSIYQTTYQLILPTVLEESSTYKALEFSQDLLSLTSPICSNGTYNNKSELINIWLTLELDKFSILASSEKLELKGANALESGSDIEQAMARYDYVVAKYQLKNFIGRTIVYSSYSPFSFYNIKNTGFVFVIIIGTLVATSIGVGLILIKKKNK